MYCRFCGKEIPDEAVLCIGCGAAVKSTKISSSAGASTETTNNPYLALILGILGIILAWVFALAGHILSIIGIVVGIKEYKNNNAVSGLAVSIMGEFCSVLSSAIGVLIVFGYF